MLITLVTFVFLSAALLKNERTLRPWLRWFLWSSTFKAEVLAKPIPTNAELKHLEWDSWGGAPVGDWTTYVVFDPTNSLAEVAKNRSRGKFAGVPCNIDQVRRLEKDWYAVTLGMNEWWDRCN